MMLPRTGLSQLRLSLAVATVAAVLASPGGAFAQASSECSKGLELFKARISWIQKIQALPKKNADPGTACSLFTKLGSANATVLSWARHNKEWCKIEDDQIVGLEREAKQVGGIRANACKVAAQFSKMKQQAEQARRSGGDTGFSVDMSADPLKPQFKIPPSAL
jgi:hypothetical protein